MKKFVLGLLIGFSLFSGVSFAAEGLKVVKNPFPVLINGVKTAVEGYNINGSTFLKLADFKKAGLTVKFNETDKQIEITSADASVAAPTSQQNNASGGSAMQTYQKDGFTIYNDSDVEYVSIVDLSQKYKSMDYEFRYDSLNKETYLVYNPEIGHPVDKGEKILGNIPTKAFNGRAYVEYSYFTETILPLIK